MARAKLEKFRTPKGVAVYPRLTQPDTKFKSGGEFSAKIRLSADDAAPLQQRIDELAQEKFDETVAALEGDTNAATKGKNKAAAKKVKLADKPYRDTVDDEGNPTGEIEFNIKMNHTITKKDGGTMLLYPRLFDAAMPKPNKLGKDVVIYGGSIIKVAGEFNPFYTSQVGAGVSLRLSAVQVIELVTGGDADSFGFEGEDGGFEAENNEAPATTEAPAGNSDEF